MNRRMRTRFTWAVSIAALLLVALAVPVSAAGVAGRVGFERVPADVVSPSGHSVLADCQGPGDAAEEWPDAEASMVLRQGHGETRLAINVRDAKPGAFYTVWLRLGGTDSNGEPFGGNPVTGGKATPLAPTWALQDLLAATGPGNGHDGVINGFRTDSKGDATLRLDLDFPLIGGAYPFQRFPDWDPTDDRLPAENPAIYPVAIAGPQGPFTLRIVSHCVDDIGHGLGSGPRELWFDWTVPS